MEGSNIIKCIMYPDEPDPQDPEDEQSFRENIRMFTGSDRFYARELYNIDREDIYTPNLYTYEDIDKLIKNYNDPNILIMDSLVLAKNSYADKGTTLLHRLATYSDKSYLIKYLVGKYNVNINAVSSFQKRTPLNFAAVYNNVENVRTLLELGADPNLTNPLEECFSRVRFRDTIDKINEIVEVCSLLLNYGSDGKLDDGISIHDFDKTLSWKIFSRHCKTKELYDEAYEKFNNMLSETNIKPAKN